jgi:hypothetical protein
VVTATLELSREQVLGQRLRANALDARLPPGPESLRAAAWAGLTDSMPRAALLSIHARVVGTGPDAWEDPSLVQLWGPRFGAYVVAAVDLPVFSLGRLPDEPVRLRRAETAASRLDAFLAGRRMTYGEAGHAMGIAPNSLRYGAPTGRILMRWEGARQPVVWTVPPPTMEPDAARLEVARRYLRVFGPGTAAGFSNWAGIRPPRAGRTFDALAPERIAVRTPIGEGWILASDEPAFRSPAMRVDGVRLLPSGDALFLLWGADRSLLVPDAAHRPQLWTPRVWPGALLVDGEIAGTWRRADATVVIEPWRALSDRERDAVEAEAASLPIPGFAGSIVVRWEADERRRAPYSGSRPSRK